MDKLSDDLKIEIVSRLSIQMLGCLMCVSKGWHNFITSTTTTSYLPVKFYGIVIREEYGKADELLLAIIWNSFGNDTKFYYPNDFGTNTKWLDYCNGFFLFWHRYKDKSLLNIKHYVVFNPLTKQYVTVDKPIPRSRDRDYAVLAYDPCRSNFFQIVRFESSTHLKVFFSETDLIADSNKINLEVEKAPRSYLCMQSNSNIALFVVDGVAFDVNIGFLVLH
ncbi:hypothetical protein ACFE04_026603 [Oxalis oulophora]